MWKFTVQAMWKTHLNFKGCRGSALRGLSGQGMWKKQKYAPIELLKENIFRGAQSWKCTTEESASFPAFSWTRLSNLHQQTGPPFLRVSDLHTVVQPGTDTVHLHGFLLCPICTTLYSIFDACWKLFSCDWLKWVNVNVQYTYCCASLLYPSMVGTWRSRFKLNIGWKPQKKLNKKNAAFKRRPKTGNSCSPETYSISFRSFCVFETTLLYFEERTFVELLVPYSTIYSCCWGQCCSFVLNLLVFICMIFWICT